MGMTRGRASAPALALATIAASLLLITPASAQAPDFLLNMPEGQITPGGGAAELSHPRAAAGDPATGHVYVAENLNARISEYTAWGLFVKAWGWDVAPEGVSGDTPADELETCGPAQPEGSPASELCQEGLVGEGKGQMARLLGGITVDDEGNVWAGDLENLRIQKFSPAGKFLLMLGGEVNKTKVESGSASDAEENVCPFDPGDVCQAGTTGTGSSHLTFALGDLTAYNPTLDAIMVGDEDRIQVFDLDGSYREEIAFEGDLADLDGKTVRALDVDPAGNIYLILEGGEDVFKLSATGEPLAPGEPGDSSFKVKAPRAVAVDNDGRVYAVEAGFLGGKYVLGFEASGSPIEGMEAADEFGGEHDISGLATNECSGSDGPNLYITHFIESFGTSRSYVSAYGPGPIGCELPPERPPVIGDQYATSVGREEATVRAEINPKFWADTTYLVEYGTDKCSKGGCGSKAPLSPVTLTDKGLNASITTVGVVLEGLEPGTTYHYRFVAQSTGGGPVFGIDPDAEDGPLEASTEDGLEASFRTFSPATPVSPCANDGLRAGPAAMLPDCRGYEMVSPLDKGNADVVTWLGRGGLKPWYFEIDQSAASGERFTFTSATAFDDPQSAPFAAQYLAERTGKGWESESISPPRTEPPIDDAGGRLSGEFRAFSEDLCSAWTRHNSVAPLVAGAIEGFANLYRRGNCEEPPGYEAITTVPPPSRAPVDYGPILRGFSDGIPTHTIFSADDKLHPDAPSLKAREHLLYERTPKGLRFVCYLPSGKASPLPCSAGTSMGGGAADLSSLHNAISADGSRIFFTTSSAAVETKPGTIYVRIGGEETVPVSGPVSASPAFFWAAAEDGSRVIFSFDSGAFEDHLYELDVEKAITGEADAATLIAKGIRGPMGTSEDASRIYFASSEDLDAGGPAAGGARNLYLYEANPDGGGGSFTFIMALASGDFGLETPNDTEEPLQPISLSPAIRAARVSPDGNHAVFMSSVSPTPIGYDNLDATSGQPAAEVYLYDAAEDELRCVSCNPTGARPSGANLGPFWGAARIQGWELFFHGPRVLSDDGTRVFFESHEALVPQDTNGTWDIYQWEEPGKGSCSESNSTYGEASGGCVELISSGQSPAVSVFLDADPSGDNVFFGTQSSLVGADYGLNDVYDARVGGGFPEPDPRSECVEGGCQNPPPPPPDLTPASESSRGQGNATPGRKACPKGKRRVVRKGKARCVKKRPGKPQGRRRSGGKR